MQRCKNAQRIRDELKPSCTQNTYHETVDNRAEAMQENELSIVKVTNELTTFFLITKKTLTNG